MKVSVVRVLAENAKPEDIKAMRDWLKDCGEWSNMEDEDFDRLSPAAVVAGVQRYYFGGVAQFYRDGVPR